MSAHDSFWLLMFSEAFFEVENGRSIPGFCCCKVVFQSFLMLFLHQSHSDASFYCTHRTFFCCHMFVAV